MGLFFLACAGAVLAMEPPNAVGDDASKGTFSAVRALRWVEKLADGPRPPGSAAHARARDTIKTALESLGATVRIERGTAVRDVGTHVRAAVVENIVAEYAGEGSPIVLAAHYDSVPTGPGAADDASGVAVVLEVVRALREGSGKMPRLRIWITDAEESGLLGARQLIDSKTASTPGIVLNLESRGGGGPVFCFQSGEGNLELVRRLARSGRLSTSSLMVSLYRRLPNGTDFTVFRDAGFAGFDFAFIGHWSAYHTALDTPENLDIRSVQQEGDAVLSFVRTLAMEPEPALARTDGPSAGWFDVLGRWIVVFPIWWTWPAVGATVCLYVIGCMVATKDKGAGKGFLLGCACASMGMAIAVAVPFGLRRAFPDPAVDLPWGEAWGIRGIEAALCAWAVLIAGALGGLAMGKVRNRAVPLGGLFPWVAAMVFVAATEPGAAWWFVLPVVPAILSSMPPKAAPALAVPSVLVWCVLVVPVIHGVALALGWPGREILVGLVAFATPLALVAVRGDTAPKWGAALMLVMVVLAGGAYGWWSMTREDAGRPEVRTDFQWVSADGKAYRIHRPVAGAVSDSAPAGAERDAEDFVPWLSGDWIAETTPAAKVPANVRTEGDTLVLVADGAVPEWLVWTSARCGGVEWSGSKVPLVDGFLRMRIVGGEAAEQRLRFAGGAVPSVHVVALRYDAGGLRPAGETAVPAPLWPPPGGIGKAFVAGGRAHP